MSPNKHMQQEELEILKRHISKRYKIVGSLEEVLTCILNEYVSLHQDPRDLHRFVDHKEIVLFVHRSKIIIFTNGNTVN